MNVSCLDCILNLSFIFSFINFFLLDILINKAYNCYVSVVKHRTLRRFEMNLKVSNYKMIHVFKVIFPRIHPGIVRHVKTPSNVLKYNPFGTHRINHRKGQRISDWTLIKE